MKYRILSIMLALSAVAAPVLAWGQAAPTASAPLKVGVINMQQAIASTQEGKKAVADLQKKYDPRQKDLQRQQEEIQSLQDQLQRQSTLLSDDEANRLTRELQDKQKIFKRAQEDAQSDFQEDNKEAIQRIGRKMEQVIHDYSQQNGFGLIVDAAQVPIYFVAPQFDITAEIIKRYDAAYPVAASADSPATGPAAKSSPASASPSKPAAKTKP